ncbi:MAG: glycerophosphodiester phosphodiesterase [Bacteroidia bacterium]|nr:glycerophosphodiester phosphodiesterase [Bacteroidia bacterium]
MRLNVNGNNFCIILVLVLINACTKNDIGTISNLSNGSIAVIGHGGSGIATIINPYPWNSWTSITRAIDGYGADGVEVDVQLSKDDIPILYHDIALESMTNCDGCIRNVNSGDLENCEYDFDLSFGKEYLIKLEKVLQRYASYDDPPEIYLDLRSDNLCDPTIDSYRSELSSAISMIIDRFSAHSFIRIGSNDQTLLNQIANLQGTVKVYYQVDNIDLAIPIAVASNYAGLIISGSKASKEQVASAHSMGIEIVLFGMRSRSKILSALKKHPDAVITDDINLTISLLY